VHENPVRAGLVWEISDLKLKIEVLLGKFR